MKKYAFFTFAIIALLTIFTCCKEGVVGCTSDINSGYWCYFYLLKFDTDKDLSKKVIIVSFDSTDDPNKEPSYPFLAYGNPTRLHKDYFFSYGEWNYCDFYVLSLTYDDLRNHGDGWIEKNWRDYVEDNLVVSEVYSIVVSRCRYQDSYYRDMPFFVRANGDEEGEDCLYYSKSFIPNHYLSRKKINQLIDDGTIFTYFKEYNARS